MTKRILLLLMSVIIVALVACSDDSSSESDNTNNNDNAASDNNGESSNLNETGFPIVNDQITLDFFTLKSNISISYDWNEDFLVWDEYENMTNIDINWSEQVSADALEEKRNLALASGNLPDVFYATNLPATDLFKYGQQGTFVALNDLIEQYAPNLNQFLEDNPSVKKGITFPDGNIYSLPYLQDEAFLSIRLSARPWFNQEWLDALGMDLPETTDELYDYLVAIKEGDPNGNGDTDDEIPYGGVNIDNLIGWVKGAFGLGTKGGQMIDIDPETDELRYIPVSEEYKQMIEYLNKLYSEELIEQNIYSIEWAQFMSAAQEEKYGVTVFYGPNDVWGQEVGNKFTHGVPLEGPDGHRLYSQVNSPLTTVGKFAITSENEHPEATMRWVDYFYGEEGAELMYMGIEGETFEVVDGEYQYVDEIRNSSEFEQEMASRIPWHGIGPPGVVKQQFFKGSESGQQSLDATAAIEPYVPEEIWPAFTYTQEETSVLQSTGTDIEKYVTESRDLFITGELPLSEWDNYVETIENMGLAEYMEVQQAALDRYENN